MVTTNLIEESKSWISLPRFIGKRIHIMTIHYKPIIFMGSKSKQVIFFFLEQRNHKELIALLNYSPHTSKNVHKFFA